MVDTPQERSVVMFELVMMDPLTLSVMLVVIAWYRHEMDFALLGLDSSEIGVRVNQCTFLNVLERAIALAFMPPRPRGRRCILGQPASSSSVVLEVINIPWATLLLLPPSVLVLAMACPRRMLVISVTAI